MSASNQAPPGDGNSPSMGVVICAFTEDRFGDLIQGATAVVDMLSPADRVVVVIDHNEPLARRVREALPASVIIARNTGARGLSSARNCGVAELETDVVAFLDDDALPVAGWLEGLRQHFSDATVAAVGGAIRPRWDGGVEPRWFPPEFGWVIGCDYRGLPGDGAEIRNPIGASMAVRRDLITLVGGFSSALGRVGTAPTGNEETELAIKIRQTVADVHIIRATRPVVLHRVPRSRQTLRYFLRRCHHEGRSKARLSAVVGSSDALRAERAYALRTLSTGTWLHLRDGLRGEPAGFARVVLLPTGLAATTLGYAAGRLHAWVTREQGPADSDLPRGALEPNRSVEA